MSIHVHLLIPVTSPKGSPDEELQYCRGERAIGGNRSKVMNGFTCTSVCSCWGRQEDMEAASVKEAKEEVNDLALQHGDWRKWVRGSEGQQLLD